MCPFVVEMFRMIGFMCGIILFIVSAMRIELHDAPYCVVYGYELADLCYLLSI